MAREPWFAALRERLDRIAAKRGEIARCDDLDDRAGARHFLDAEHRNVGIWLEREGDGILREFERLQVLTTMPAEGKAPRARGQQSTLSAGAKAESRLEYLSAALERILDTPHYENHQGVCPPCMAEVALRGEPTPRAANSHPGSDA